MELLPPGVFGAVAKVINESPYRKKIVGGIAIGAVLLAFVGGTVLLWTRNTDYSLPFFVVAGVLVGVVLELITRLEQAERSVTLEAVAQESREHPEKTKLAWDLARIKLEHYLDRNLSQVRSIYWLTVGVMLCGFALIVYGLQQSFSSTDKLAVSIVASASGVLVSFIGGSFLLIYRSILAQTKEYVGVLERINAVGMAVQVIDTMSTDGAATRDKSIADLSKQLLAMYGSPQPAARSRAPRANVRE